jgi:hypothetical protein
MEGGGCVQTLILPPVIFMSIFYPWLCSFNCSTNDDGVGLGFYQFLFLFSGINNFPVKINDFIDYFESFDKLPLYKF